MRNWYVAVALSCTLVMLGAPRLVRSAFSAPPAPAKPTFPDWEGATWNFATMTPLERPRGINVAQLSIAAATKFEIDTAKGEEDNATNGADWWDEGNSRLDRRRTSLIVDPDDGHLPPMLPQAQVALAQRQARLAKPFAEGPEDFTLNTRCLWWRNAGPPMIPSPYNNNVQFIVTSDTVLILNENIHDARIIPTDGRPHGRVPRWAGDSRGRWEGDALVIDTVGFTATTNLRGSDENLHLTERFTAVDHNTIEYRFTVEDPTVWTKPWSAVLRMHRTDSPVYEFACHEGNARSIEGLLRGARALEAGQPR